MPTRKPSSVPTAGNFYRNNVRPPSTFSRTHFRVNFRQRRNPATAGAKEKAKKAGATVCSPQLEPRRAAGNRSGQKKTTKSPPKAPKTPPTPTESMIRASLVILDCLRFRQAKDLSMDVQCVALRGLSLCQNQSQIQLIVRLQRSKLLSIGAPDHIVKIELG